MDQQPVTVRPVRIRVIEAIMPAEKGGKEGQFAPEKADVVGRLLPGNIVSATVLSNDHSS
jgi:hypothetical protein